MDIKLSLLATAPNIFSIVLPIVRNHDALYFINLISVSCLTATPHAKMICMKYMSDVRIEFRVFLMLMLFCASPAAHILSLTQLAIFILLASAALLTLYQRIPFNNAVHVRNVAR